ncbi:DUF4145 domain-containing protein [Ferruginibacter sp.]
MATTLKQILTECSDCDRETKQRILFLKRVKTADPDNAKDIEIEEFMTLECGGCGSISFMKRDMFTDPSSENEIVVIDKHYPNDDLTYDEYSFLRDIDQEQLPQALYDLYDEIIDAFETESKVLAGIGLRTLVEAICVHQKIPGRILKTKIENLQISGLISSAELPILDKLRQIGNDATHDLKTVSIDKLGYALEIVNHVLISIYILPKINKKLKLSTVKNKTTT